MLYLPKSLLVKAIIAQNKKEVIILGESVCLEEKNQHKK